MMRGLHRLTGQVQKPRLINFIGAAFAHWPIRWLQCLHTKGRFDMPRGKQQFIAVYIFVPERGQLIMKCVLISNYKYRQMVACGWSAADIMEGVALHHTTPALCNAYHVKDF
jgi:hypothetical protein